MSRFEIEDLLTRYTRAVDRCDRRLFQSVWAEGARVDYGDGPVDAFAWSDGLLERLRAMDRTHHALSNFSIAIEGDTAVGETMCTAYHRFVDNGAPLAMVVGGRYLDQMVRTSAGWRIIRRQYVMDWNETSASTCEVGTGRFARFTHVGQRGSMDPSYHVCTG